MDPAVHKARIFISYSHPGDGPEWKAALLRALHVFEQHHLLDVLQDGKSASVRFGTATLGGRWPTRSLPLCS